MLNSLVRGVLQSSRTLTQGTGRGRQFSAPTGSEMRSVAAVVALVACVHLGLWALGRAQTNAPNFEGPLASVSYAPYDGRGHPDTDNRPTIARIRADLQVLAPLTRAVRTYSSTGGVELVPRIAGEF